MKNFCLIIYLIFPFLLPGQTIDSLYIKQIDSLIQISRSLTTKQDFNNALEIGLLAEKLAMEKFDSLSPTYGRCCFNHGRVMFYKGDLEQAEIWYLKAKGIQEKVLGKESDDYGRCLISLGNLYYSVGMYQESESNFLEFKNILEKLQRNGSMDYSNNLSNLGSVYNQMGQFEKAESYFLEAKVHFENSIGKEHPSYGVLLNNIATLNHASGNYEKAEIFYLEAMSILGTAGGMESLNIAALKFNLATLYQSMGQFQKAELYYLEAIDIVEKVQGKEQLNYAEYTHGLATMYINSGQYEKLPDQFKKAEPLLNESLRIIEQIQGTQNQKYAQTLNSLAILYNSMKQFLKAESFYIKAKTIQASVLGKEHPDYATSLHNLASMYMDMGQFEKSKPFILEALEIRRKIQGKEHPEYVQSLHELATLYANSGEFEKAGHFYLEESEINRKLIERASRYLSQREMGPYESKFSINQDQIASFIQKSYNTFLIPDFFNNSLFYKGFLLNAACQIRNLAMKDSLSKEYYLSFLGLQRQLSAEYSKGVAQRSSEIVKQIEETSNKIERELVQSIAGYGQALRQVSWQDVQKKLKPGECAIEFVHFHNHLKDSTEQIFYAALLLKSGEAAPIFISLFDELQLDSLLNSSVARKADYVNSLYTLSDRGAVAVEETKKSLYEILWQPLEKELSGIKTIYFSPSGLLHRINLDAIPISETETLADKFQMIELTSTRQLVIPTPIKNVQNDAVLFGGIQFEQDSTLQNNEPLIASRFRGELSFQNVDSTLRGGNWNYLPGTEREVNSIDKIMQTSGVQTKLKKGYSATEESFKNIGANNSPSPRILHIATHGYFFSDPGESHQSSVISRQEEIVFKISEYPMLRSGLIMAGGNAAWQGKQTLEGREDGILTAYEISQMNLSNTELVVLSACETGLGEIQGNEGVYGLQRAFKIAGAKFLIMSLWQVPDKQTSLLMTTFYKKWLEDKMAIPDAFHAAQKELREIGLDPYQWAGFVLVE